MPGTINIKGSESTECRVIRLDNENAYRLDNFLEFKNPGYMEPEEASTELPTFGIKQSIVSLKDPDTAQADVKRLEVDSRTQKRIITGSLLTAKDADKTRSERDMSNGGGESLAAEPAQELLGAVGKDHDSQQDPEDGPGKTLVGREQAPEHRVAPAIFS